MVRTPERGPPADGMKTTCMVQAVFTARVAPQLLLPGTMEKSPVSAVLCKRSGTPPLFVSVTVCAAEVRPTPVFGKVTVENGASDTPGGATPVPLSVTVWVRYWSDTDSMPVSAPMFLG